MYPEVTRLQLGASSSLTCTAQGFPLPQIIWLKDGAPISANGNNINTTSIDIPPSAVTSILDLCDVQLLDSGEYQCRASNSITGVFTNDDDHFFNLVVLSKLRCDDSAPYKSSFCAGEPYVTIHPSPDQTILAAGQEITLSCASTGNPTPNITWTLNGEELRVNETLFSAILLLDAPYRTQSSLTIGPATPNVIGTYQCLARGLDFQGEPVVVMSNTSQLTFHCKSSQNHDIIIGDYTCMYFPSTS